MTEADYYSTIESVLDQIRPNIQMDGGDVELVRFQDGIVYIRLMGACVGCPASMYTVKLGIEQSIKDVLPEVIEVVTVDEEDN